MRKLNSNFFNMHGVVPPAQKVIANRNWSSSSFLRLPPEIRGRIYAIVFGGEKVHIGRTDNKINWKSKNQLNWKKIWELERTQRRGTLLFHLGRVPLQWIPPLQHDYRPKIRNSISESFASAGKFLQRRRCCRTNWTRSHLRGMMWKRPLDRLWDRKRSWRRERRWGNTRWWTKQLKSRMVSC